MIDSFVLLAPLLMLPVVALFAFVGCDRVFGLSRPPAEPIPGPAGLVASPGNGKVVLSWDPYPEATKFTVRRGETSGVYTTTMSDIMQPTYTDPNATNGITYFYVVTAMVAGEESNYSEEASATPSLAALLSFARPTMLGTTFVAANGWFGMAILVGAAPVSVQRLGRGFFPGNSQIHVIKIVAADGMDLLNAFVSVSMAGGTMGEFRYAPLNPAVVLAPGTKYYIVSQEIAGGDNFYNHNTTVTTTDVASVIQSVKGGPPYVQDSLPDTTYGPVDFQY